MMTETAPTADGIGGADRARPELLDVEAVGKLLTCSQRTVYRMADAGKMPRPVKLGSLVRWRRGELLDWLDAGCPRVRTVSAGVVGR